MKNLMGLIYTGERDSELRELTANRAVAAVPFGGRYRVIDFILSSLVGAGIKNVGVIMQKNYHSLMDHLGSGREWDLHGKREGLVILPPFLTRDSVGVYSGFLDALRANLPYLRKSSERYVVVADTHMIYSQRFDDMAAEHLKSGADVTMLCTLDPGARRNGAGRYLNIDGEGNITDMEIDPGIPRYPATYMDAFIIRRELLIHLVDLAASRGQTHFTRDILMSGLRDQTLSLRACVCPDRCFNIDSVSAYYEASMALLDPAVRAALFDRRRPVLTKLRDEMPARYGENALVRDSLVADGCVVEGEVERSILFRGARVEKGAKVVGCIVMQDGRVRENAQVENCIFDKQTTVRPATRLLGPRAYPIVIAKNMTV